MDRGVTSLARQAAAAARAEREAAERALLPVRPRRRRCDNHAAAGAQNPAASSGQVRPAAHETGYEPAHSHPPAAAAAARNARDDAARAAPNVPVPLSPAADEDVDAALMLQQFAAATFRSYAGFRPEMDVPVSDLPVPTAFSSTDGVTIGASGSLPAALPGVPPAWLSTMPGVAGPDDQSVIADNFTDSVGLLW